MLQGLQCELQTSSTPS